MLSSSMVEYLNELDGKIQEGFHLAYYEGSDIIYNKFKQIQNELREIQGWKKENRND